MKPVATVAQMRECDRQTIEEIGLPGIVLMETASRAVASKAVQMLGGDAHGKHVAIFCGKGNNGGDGLACSRHLLNLGAQVTCLLVGKIDSLQVDAKTNAELLLKSNGKILELAAISEIPEAVRRSDLVIDALLGTGFSGELTGFMRELVEFISKFGAPVLAVDIPSGVAGDSGATSGSAIQVVSTVTFGLLKPGLLLPPGRDLAGEVTIADIGIPSGVVGKQGIKLFQVEDSDVRAVIPKRLPDAHKGDAGFVYLLAGSPGLTGAAALAAEAAVRTGAGLVVVGVPHSLNPILEAKLTEAMTEPLWETPTGGLSYQAIEKVAPRLEWADAVAIGPGMGRDPDSGALLQRVIELIRKPLVIDADGLNLLAERPELLRKLPRETVITPHPGELARLTGLKIAEILTDRIGIARHWAAEWGVVLHFKGAPSVTASPDGRAFINSTGNAGMATGGSGDVLTGIIVALLAAGLPALEATWAGAFIHGRAGDLANDQKGILGMAAGDIVSNLPTTLRSYY